MKKIICTVLGVLAVMAMEFLLLVMLVGPDWFRKVLVILGIVLAGLVLSTVLACTGYRLGWMDQRKKADAHIESLQEKYSKEINQLNADWNADIRAEISRVDQEHTVEIARLKAKYSQEKAELVAQHSAETARLNDRIAELGVQMSKLGRELPHNLELLENLEDDEDEF